MKCAMELMMTATVKAEENARRAEEMAKEEAIRIARKEAAKITNTIKYCEELGHSLEAIANKGKKPTVSFFCDKKGTRLKETTREYADRRLSYTSCGETLNLEVMAEWFDPYCFDVIIEDFQYWKYTCGRVDGYKVTITPKPVCIN